MKISAAINRTFGLILLGTGFIFFIITFHDWGWMELFFVRISYYLLAILLIAWVLVAVDIIKERQKTLKDGIGRHFQGLLFALFVTLVVSVSVETRFRVFSDETNYLAVSKALFERREAWMFLETMNIKGIIVPISTYLEKHPLFFPFLLQLLHALLGYHLFNPFVLNFMVLFGFLFLSYVIACQVLGKIWGYCVVILIVAQPIVSLTANSGQADLLNLLLIFANFGLLYSFLVNPSPVIFRFLWLTMLLSAHTRYESLIIFPITLIMLVLLKRVKWEYFQKPALFALTPLLLMPLFWQRILKIREQQLPGHSILKSFGLDYFSQNNWSVFKSLGRFDFYLPFATLINILGIVSVTAFFCFFLTSDHRDRARRDLVLISAANTAAIWLITTFYYFGKIDHPASARLFIFPAVIASFFTVALFKSLSAKLNLKASFFILLSVILFFSYHPIAMADKFSRSLLSAREYEAITGFLRQHPGKNHLLIAKRFGLFTIHPGSVVGFKTANSRSRQILADYEQNVYSEIFVAQEIDILTKLPDEATRLDPSFTLIPLAEFKHAPQSIIRISKVAKTWVDFRHPLGSAQTPAKEEAKGPILNPW
jgi:hypothetical protein